MLSPLSLQWEQQTSLAGPDWDWLTVRISPLHNSCVPCVVLERNDWCAVYPVTISSPAHKADPLPHPAAGGRLPPPANIQPPQYRYMQGYVLPLPALQYSWSDDCVQQRRDFYQHACVCNIPWQPQQQIEIFTTRKVKCPTRLGR